MKKCKFLSAAVAGVMAAAMALTGCTNGNGSTEGAKNTMFPGTSEANSLTINIGPEPQSMNSTITTDTVGINALLHVKDGLLMKDSTDKPQPATAEKYEVSEDGLTWTFHLRKDAVWEDGKPVTSHDFKFGWMKVLDPEVASTYSYMLYYIKGAKEYNLKKGSEDDVAIVCPDDKTLIVTLAGPCTFFDSLVSYPTYYPVREDEWGKDYATEANKMHYNGMFTLAKWVHNDRMVFEKNDKYYAADKCKLDKFTGLMLIDSSAAINAFKSGELDMVGLSTGDQVKEMEATYPGVQIDAYADGSSFCLMFNYEDKIFQNINIRKALSKALDRTSYINNIKKDKSVVTYHWTPGWLLADGKKFSEVWNEPLFKDADVEGAKADWEKGCKELGIPANTEIEFLTDDSEQAKVTAEYIQGCMAKAGINVSIRQLPFQQRIESQTKGEYQFSLYAWGPDYNDPQTFLELWETGTGNNKARYSNPAYDEAMQVIRGSADSAERLEAMVKAEQILAEDFAIAPFFNRENAYVVSSKVNNIIRTPFQDWSLREASCN